MLADLQAAAEHDPVLQRILGVRARRDCLRQPAPAAASRGPSTDFQQSLRLVKASLEAQQLLRKQYAQQGNGNVKSRSTSTAAEAVSSESGSAGESENDGYTSTEEGDDGEDVEDVSAGSGAGAGSAAGSGACDDDLGNASSCSEVGDGMTCADGNEAEASETDFTDGDGGECLRNELDQRRGAPRRDNWEAGVAVAGGRGVDGGGGGRRSPPAIRAGTAATYAALRQRSPSSPSSQSTDEQLIFPAGAVAAGAPVPQAYAASFCDEGGMPWGRRAAAAAAGGGGGGAAAASSDNDSTGSFDLSDDDPGPPSEASSVSVPPREPAREMRFLRPTASFEIRQRMAILPHQRRPPAAAAPPAPAAASGAAARPPPPPRRRLPAPSPVELRAVEELDRVLRRRERALRRQRSGLACNRTGAGEWEAPSAGAGAGSGGGIAGGSGGSWDFAPPHEHFPVDERSVKALPIGRGNAQPRYREADFAQPRSLRPAPVPPPRRQSLGSGAPSSAFGAAFPPCRHACSGSTRELARGTEKTVQRTPPSGGSRSFSRLGSRRGETGDAPSPPSRAASARRRSGRKVPLSVETPLNTSTGELRWISSLRDLDRWPRAGENGAPTAEQRWGEAADGSGEWAERPVSDPGRRRRTRGGCGGEGAADSAATPAAPAAASPPAAPRGGPPRRKSQPAPAAAALAAAPVPHRSGAPAGGAPAGGAEGGPPAPYGASNGGPAGNGAPGPAPADSLTRHFTYSTAVPPVASQRSADDAGLMHEALGVGDGGGAAGGAGGGAGGGASAPLGWTRQGNFPYHPASAWRLPPSFLPPGGYASGGGPAGTPFDAAQSWYSAAVGAGQRVPPAAEPAQRLLHAQPGADVRDRPERFQHSVSQPTFAQQPAAAPGPAAGLGAPPPFWGLPQGLSPGPGTDWGASPPAAPAYPQLWGEGRGRAGQSPAAMGEESRGGRGYGGPFPGGGGGTPVAGAAAGAPWPPIAAPGRYAYWLPNGDRTVEFGGRQPAAVAGAATASAARAPAMNFAATEPGAGVGGAAGAIGRGSFPTPGAPKYFLYEPGKFYVRTAAAGRGTSSPVKPGAGGTPRSQPPPWRTPRQRTLTPRRSVARGLFGRLLESRVG